MATIYKILAQSAPVGTTNTLLYGPVGAGIQTVVSTIAICNRGNTSATYRISVRENGAADSSKQYLVFDSTIPSTSTITYTLGITLKTGDAIYVLASNNFLSFNAFGSEITD
jgi:hypothetical protein